MLAVPSVGLSLIPVRKIDILEFKGTKRYVMSAQDSVTYHTKISTTLKGHGNESGVTMHHSTLNGQNSPVKDQFGKKKPGM